VKEAFGEKWGFTAVWLQWFMMTIGFIGVLTFLAASFSYLFDPTLQDNKLYQFVVVVIVCWVFTFINFKGMKVYTRSNSLFVVIGVFIPCILLIGGGLWLVGSGHPILLNLHPTLADFIPDFSSPDNLVLLITFVFMFTGIEVTSFHLVDIKNVKRNYPISIFVVSLILIILPVNCSLIISALVPADSLNMLGGVMQTFEVMFGAGILTAIIALLISIGAIGQISAWILGPVRGLVVSAKDGNLPPIFQKTNEHGMPVNMMILQAIVVTFWGVVYVILPGDVNGSFWMLISLATLVAIVMTILIYLSLIKLRYSQPNVKRAFKIPGGKIGLWIFAAWSIISMLFLFNLGVIPPSQITDFGFTYLEYVVVMLVSTIIIVLIPLIIHKKRNKSWLPENHNIR
ncbi:MAG: amino acid permease, partial [Methanobrevibacter sp.]|nr:amino acid permease [Methanobrevibacter sp.]MCF0227102.1 amino acid permease [Methanobrevibacter sp.]